MDLTIDDLGAQGDGLAHDEKGTIFVAAALPRERVRVEIEKTHDGQRRGRLVELLQASPDRAAPPCPHFGVCGGCRFQHMTREAYTRHKETQLQVLLSKAGLGDAPVAPAMVTQPGTRRRARFAARHTKNGVVLGFNGWRSATIVDVRACPVLRPALEAFLPRLRENLSLWLPPHTNCDIQVTALPDGLDVLLIGGPEPSLEARLNLGDLAQALDVAHLSWRKGERTPVDPIAHRDPLPVRYGETSLPFPPGSFLQATEDGERALIAFAQKALRGATAALDLFSGLGAFGLSLPEAKRVHFADLDGPATAALACAARQNPRFSVSERNLAKEPFSARESDAFDGVLFDPPRGGAKAQAEELAQSRAPRVVAVSCDPVSFARDAQILLAGGYRLTAIQPVDQFLWSPHLELAAAFEK